jgi:hypothetical protein
MKPPAPTAKPVQVSPFRGGRRRFAYRNGKMCEITHERSTNPRGPLIKVLGVNDKLWNRP